VFFQGLDYATRHEVNMGAFASIDSLLPFLKDIVGILCNDKFTIEGQVMYTFM